MEDGNVMKRWDKKYKNESEVCEQIREMCSWKDRCDITLLNKEEYNPTIECLNTG